MWDLLSIAGAGAVAGVLAKALVPGEKREPKGCLMTMILGIAGSLFTATIMRVFLGWSGSGKFIPTVIGATIGAVGIIFLLRAFWKDPVSSPKA